MIRNLQLSNIPRQNIYEVSCRDENELIFFFKLTSTYDSMILYKELFDKIKPYI